MQVQWANCDTTSKDGLLPVWRSPGFSRELRYKSCSPRVLVWFQAVIGCKIWWAGKCLYYLSIAAKSMVSKIGFYLRCSRESNAIGISSDKPGCAIFSQNTNVIGSAWQLGSKSADPVCKFPNCSLCLLQWELSNLHVHHIRFCYIKRPWSNCEQNQVRSTTSISA